MKKKLSMVCKIISVVLVILFIVKCNADYYEYINSFNSAPFSLWIEVNALFLIVPAIIVFIIGILVR